MAIAYMLLALVLGVTFLGLDAADSSEHCHCEIPTPCMEIDTTDLSSASENGTKICRTPMPGRINHCPLGTKDCRGSALVECEVVKHAEAGFCCWTPCSSLAFRRDCDEPPLGFAFEKSVDRHDSDCKDYMNVRQKCCLRELHLQKTLKKQAAGCPKKGHTLASIFGTIDGNSENAANSELSPIEVMNTLKWLHEKGYQFVADDFHKIDEDKNHRVSWYELQLYCGHSGEQLPAEDLTGVKPSNMLRILSNPMYLGAILASFVVGELFGILQVVVKHVLRMPIEEDWKIKTVYVVLSQLWPVAWIAIAWCYFFGKVQWDVCDSDGDIVWKFKVFGIAITLVRLNNLNGWRVRRCPLKPSLDLERRAFIQQALFRRMGRLLTMLFTGLMIIISSYSLYSALFVGTFDEFGLKEKVAECRREDPDLALLFDVNDKYFLWNVFNQSFLQVYLLFSFPIQDKAEYERIPETENMLPMITSSMDRDRVNEAENTEKGKWHWFQ